MRGLPTIGDIRLLARIALYALLVGVVPQRGWRRALAIVQGPWDALRHKQLAATVAPDIDALTQALAPADGVDRCTRIKRSLYTHREDLLCLLRDYWPGRWRTKFELRGADRVHDGLSRGKGVILWVGLTHNRLGWKKALHENGIQVGHLSRSDHGFSVTAFGQRYINPICTRIEERYVERIVIPPNGEAATVRRLLKRLAHNGVVSIQDAGMGRSLELPFLNGYRSFFLGPPNIAFTSGATLLPAFPFRESDGSFGMTIGTAIQPPAGVPKAAAVEAMAREFARQLSDQAAAFPEFWNWRLWSPTPKHSAERM